MSDFRLPPASRPGFSRKAKGWTIAIAVLFVLWLIGKVSGDGDNADGGAAADSATQNVGGNSFDGASASPATNYVVATTTPAATEIMWSSTGATAGSFDSNKRVLTVPTALQGMPVKVCWQMDGETNSLETAAGPDDISLASGSSIPDDDSNVSGDSCADPVTLQSYLEVLPSDNWTITVTESASVATAPTTQAPSPTTSPSPTHHKKKRAPVEPLTAEPSSAPASCYPLTNGGNCYEPGEFCRHSDEGVSGVAGDGESIICEDNNGLRWEPV